MPMFCLDLKQEMVIHGIDRKELPRQDGVEHNALHDARWLERMHKFISILKDRERNPMGPPW